MTRVYFTVSFEKPPRAKLSDMKEYIADAVKAWRGQLYPGGIEGYPEEPDAMWELNEETVRVVRLQNK
jgi:hypothetical protein